jgi:hypothetical protein|tara:strand:+ start:21 stop:812 length:792 start_codon:yes stop_codon:yes gene_type:complete
MSEMKLIMEGWRTYTSAPLSLTEITAQGEPENVGELLDAINKYTLIKGNKAKKILKSLIEVLKVFLDTAQDIGNLEEDVGKLVEWFEEALEGQWAEAIAAIPITSVINILSKDPLRTFIVSKIGTAALEALLTDLLPGAATALKFGKWFSRMFKVSKELKAAVDTATANPKEVFTMIVTDIMGAQDDKETTKGFMGIFNIDDHWAAMLDDGIEFKFIEKQINDLQSYNPSTRLDVLNFNEKLITYLQDEFEGRTLVGAQAAAQ